MTHLNNGTAFAMYTTTNNTIHSNGLTGTTLTTYGSPTVTWGSTNVGPAFIGWDKQMAELEKIGERIVKNSGNFPPYNVIKEDEDTFLIEFAVAGFSKKDITVEQEKNALIITGSIEEDEDKKYVHKGIATRSFTRAFALAEYVEVKSAEFEDGILTVKLVRELPKEEKPRQITIK